MLNYIPMTDTITIQRAVGVDSWGIPTAGTDGSEISARISYNTKRKTIQNVDGEHVVFTAEVLLRGTPEVSFTDSIVWTDKLGNVQDQKPLSVEYKSNFAGDPIMVKVVV